MKMNLSHYGLWLTAYNVAVDASDTTTVTFTMTATLQAPNLEEFSRDVSLLNAIRSNSDASVKDQWEKLLTTIALTNGRVGPDVIDSIASKK